MLNLKQPMTRAYRKSGNNIKISYINNRFRCIGSPSKAIEYVSNKNHRRKPPKLKAKDAIEVQGALRELHYPCLLSQDLLSSPHNHFSTFIDSAHVNWNLNSVCEGKQCLHNQVRFIWLIVMTSIPLYMS